VTPTPSITPTPTITPTRTPTPPLPRGPKITYFGIANAEGFPSTPNTKDADDNPVFIRHGGFGFHVVVEAKSGTSLSPPGTKNLQSDANDPAVRPDLQIQSDHDLGDNPTAFVCDAAGPNPEQTPGGVPGIDPPSFDLSRQDVADALNDLACRFAYHNSSEPCTKDPDTDNPDFAAEDSTSQFCTGITVGIEYRFPAGQDTTLTVQWRDAAGNIGDRRSIVVSVP
jgi:hypothetical protein